jgi:hypothetical protein
MTKLCARGKAAAKRKFKVYPSAYANAYASKICAGKIKDPSGVKRKDWGPKKARKGILADHAKTHRPVMETETSGEYKKRSEYFGSHIKSKLTDDLYVSNKSYEDYYGDLLK